jgi:hypothetical protein
VTIGDRLAHCVKRLLSGLNIAKVGKVHAKFLVGLHFTIFYLTFLAVRSVGSACALCGKAVSWLKYCKSGLGTCKIFFVGFHFMIFYLTFLAVRSVGSA